MTYHYHVIRNFVVNVEEDCEEQRGALDTKQILLMELK